MDEGYRLVFPKNLVLHGKYALLTSDGFGPFAGGGGSGTVSTGATLILPIALAFRVLGVTLWSARLIMALYFVVCAISLYVCVRFLYEDRVALLASLLFLFAGPTWLNTVVMGRWVYGEVPALAFLFLGSSIWFASLEDTNLRRLIAASICFALAGMTKDIFAIIIIASLISVFLVDRLLSKSVKLQHVVIPSLLCLVSVIAWQVLLSILTSDLAGQDDGLLAAVGYTVFAFAPQRWSGSLKYLAEHGFILWAVPALAHTILAALNQRNSSDSCRQLFFPFFVIIWMMWYVIASIGWPRYAYPGWAVSSILVGKFLYDMATAFKSKWAFTNAPFRSLKPLLKLGHLPVLCLILILILYPAQNTIKRIVQGDNHAAHDFAHYIETELPQNSLIASAEWEIDFLTNRPYLHHPRSFQTAHIRHHQLGYPLVGQPYNVDVYNPDYVIDGPYNKGTDFISKDFIRNKGQLLFSIGEYDLYKVVSR